MMLFPSITFAVARRRGSATRTASPGERTAPPPARAGPAGSRRLPGAASCSLSTTTVTTITNRPIVFVVASWLRLLPSQQIRRHPDGVAAVLAHLARDVQQVRLLLEAGQLDQHRQVDAGDDLDLLGRETSSPGSTACRRTCRSGSARPAPAVPAEPWPPPARSPRARPRCPRASRSRPPRSAAGRRRSFPPRSAARWPAARA